MQLESLIKFMKIWNSLYSNQTGSVSIDMAQMIELTKFMENINWNIISNGKLAGSRYAVSEHGIILQKPNPSNEMSLIGKETAELLGIL